MAAKVNVIFFYKNGPRKGTTEITRTAFKDAEQLVQSELARNPCSTVIVRTARLVVIHVDTTRTCLTATKGMAKYVAREVR